MSFATCAGSGVQDDPAVLGVIEAAGAVQQGGLAGAVGTDDGMDMALGDGEAHVGQCRDAAEAQGDVMHFQQGLAGENTAGVQGVLVRPGQHGGDLLVAGRTGWRRRLWVSIGFHYVKGNTPFRN